MQVRRATPADVSDVASLVQSYWAFEAIPDFDRARTEVLLHRLFAEPSQGACWVAENQGRLCGYLLAVFMLSLEHGGLMAEIDEIFVAQEQRFLGYGAALLARAERDMADAGLIRLQLQVAVDNGVAKGFYRGHGFRHRAGYEIHDKPLGTGANNDTQKS
jgi:ribosomal protein S18 acetylase RimI-like enzyme